MAKQIVDPAQVKPFVCDESYSSKLLMDDFVAGTAAININELLWLPRSLQTATMDVDSSFNRR